jgi:pyrimidine deaminase RibD-like protein
VFVTDVGVVTTTVAHTGGTSHRETRTMTSNVTESDEVYMARALKLARIAEGKTYPNPAVGCVVTNGEKVVGEGYHPQAGAPHAEIFALRAAGQAARGGTAYVTLEPCNHFGRTPPCALALIEAGISRVRALNVPVHSRERSCSSLLPMN